MPSPMRLHAHIGPSAPENRLMWINDFKSQVRNHEAFAAARPAHSMGKL